MSLEPTRKGTSPHGFACSLLWLGSKAKSQERIVEIERNRAQVCLGNIKMNPQFEAGISDLVAGQSLPIEDLISGLT